MKVGSSADLNHAFQPLGKDVWMYTMRYLGLEDLLRLGRVSRAFHLACSDNRLWLPLLRMAHLPPGVSDLKEHWMATAGSWLRPEGLCMMDISLDGSSMYTCRVEEDAQTGKTVVWTGRYNDHTHVFDASTGELVEDYLVPTGSASGYQLSSKWMFIDTRPYFVWDRSGKSCDRHVEHERYHGIIKLARRGRRGYYAADDHCALLVDNEPQWMEEPEAPDPLDEPDPKPSCTLLVFDLPPRAEDRLDMKPSRTIRYEYEVEGTRHTRLNFFPPHTAYLVHASRILVLWDVADGTVRSVDLDPILLQFSEDLLSGVSRAKLLGSRLFLLQDLNVVVVDIHQRKILSVIKHRFGGAHGDADMLVDDAKLVIVGMDNAVFINSITYRPMYKLVFPQVTRSPTCSLGPSTLALAYASQLRVLGPGKQPGDNVVVTPFQVLLEKDLESQQE